MGIFKKTKKSSGDGNNSARRKLTAKRKKELEEEIDEIISKLSDGDVLKLEEIGELTPEEIEYIKRRKRRKKSKKRLFDESIKCDEETLRRLNIITQKFARTQQELQKENIKEKVREKEKNEITRSSSGGSKKLDERGGR